MKKEVKEGYECLSSGSKKLLADCLGRAGFSFPEKAAANFLSFRKKLESPGRFDAIFSALLRCFDPDRALNNLLRFAKEKSLTFWNEFCENPQALDTYLAVFSGSQYLTETIFNQWEQLQKEWCRWFQPCTEDFIRADLDKRLARSDSAITYLNAIKQFKDYWFLNIGTRDLLRLDPTPTVLERLSLVAEICLGAIYDHCYRELEEKYGTPMEVDDQGEKKQSAGIIIGMGKLGGQELNFSSDIDLIFIFSSEKGKTERKSRETDAASLTAKEISNQEFFTLLAQKITRVIGKELNIFRVDLDLRPEGKSGAITQCLTGAEIYYESWGQTWERMAMIKARPVAGDRELGELFLQTIHPFVYRKYLDESSFNEIRSMRDRIRHKLGEEENGRPVDVKLGDGGIREIEFIVQTFQLIYGGKIPQLETRSTIEALVELGRQGLLPAEEVEALDHAYFFLRDIENRLQMLEGRQTHHLPMKESEQNALARKMGGDNKKSRDSLMHLYQQHTQQVKNIFNKLFTPAPPPSEKPGKRKQSKDLSLPARPAEEEQVIESFKNPDKIRSLIALLKEGHTYEYPSQRSRELFDSLFNILLVQVKSQPDPELALNRFEEFARGFGAREALFGFLLENRPILEYLIMVLGTGGILCERLIQYPDFLYLISGSDAFWEEKSAFRMRREIEEQLQRTTATEERLELLAKYKMEEEFRIGFRLLVKNPDPLPIFEELSFLAQHYLEQISFLAFEEISPQDSRSLAKQLAIVAVGKFGSKEIDFGSDLDIVFVSSEADDSTFFHKICRKIIKLSQTITKYGIPYRIDLDLRPYGKSGPLVSSLSGFQTYYYKTAKPWERMAWVRSRVISGKGDLFCQIHRSIKDFVYGQGLEKREILEIELIWKKVHQEKTTNQKGRVSLKFGSGGLFDLEFITQLLQLKHGSSFPDVQRSHTYQALLALEQNKCILPATAKRLKEAYLFLRNLESRLRLTQNQPGDWIRLNDEQWENLSKRMRIYPDAEKNSGKCLRETFRKITANIKQIKSEMDSLL